MSDAVWDPRFGQEPSPEIMERVAALAAAIEPLDEMPGHNRNYLNALIGGGVEPDVLTPEAGLAVGVVTVAAYERDAAPSMAHSAESKVGSRVLRYLAGQTTSTIRQADGCARTQITDAKNRVRRHVLESQSAEQMQAALREVAVRKAAAKPPVAPVPGPVPVPVAEPRPDPEVRRRPRRSQEEVRAQVEQTEQEIAERVAALVATIEPRDTMPAPNRRYLAQLLGGEVEPHVLTAVVGLAVGEVAVVAYEKTVAGSMASSAVSRVAGRVLRYLAGMPSKEIAREDESSRTRVTEARYKVLGRVLDSPDSQTLQEELRTVAARTAPARPVQAKRAPTKAPPKPPQSPLSKHAQQYEEDPDRYEDAEEVVVDISPVDREQLEKWVSTTKGMPAEREVELAIRIAQGDESAVEEFVAGNLNLVRYIVNRHYADVDLPAGITFNDLRQWGIPGLIRCVRNFDISLGYKFSTYAYHNIRLEILRELQRHSIGQHASYRDSRLIRQASAIYVELSDEHDRRRDIVKGVADEMGVSIEEAGILLRASSRVLSLDAHDNEDDRPAFDVADTAGPYTHEPTSMYEAVDEMLSHPLLRGLSELQMRVYLLTEGILDGNQMTAAEVAELLGLSRDQVRGARNAARRIIAKNAQSDEQD